jgi:hypothetical protein
VEVSDLEGDPLIRRVTRQIVNTFCFFREIAPYWEDCAIASPDSVRDRSQQKVIALCRQYNL